MLIRLLTLWFGFACLWADGQELPYAQYTTRDGLAQMQCMAVLKDSRGYVWIGTKNGLSKFDGEHFENFTQHDGLLKNYIQSLVEDSKGYIWINNVIGLTRFDGTTFTPYPFPDKRMQAFGGTFWLDADGNPIIEVGDGQTNKILKLKKGNYIPVPGCETKSGGFLSYDRQHDCYYLQTSQKEGINSQLWYVQNGRRVGWLRTGPNVAWGFQGTLRNGIPVLYAHDQHNAALRTYFTLEQDSLIPFFRTDGQRMTVLRTLPVPALVMHSGHYYLLIANTTLLTRLPLPDTQLWQYHFDAGGLWCATEKGVFRIWLNGFRFFSEADVPYCWNVVEDRNKTMWFSNYQSPLLTWNGQQLSRMKGYESLFFKNEHSEPDNWYYHSIRDKYGSLWLSNIEGAIRYDGQQFRLITDPQNVTTMCLLEDPERNLILKGGENQVLFIDNKPPFRYTRFDQTNGFNDPNELVLAIEKDSQGFYWVGGRNLTRYDYNRRKATYYTFENGKFPAKGVYSLCLDNRKTVWVASAKGLLRYDVKQDRFRMVLNDSLVTSVMLVGEFDKDHLLFGDMHNLYVMDLLVYYQTGQVRVKAFNHHNGFMGLEPGQNGYYRDSRGRIWITSGTVLSQLNPQEIDLRPTPLRLFITKAGQQRIPFVRSPSIITLPKDENTVSFTVETLGDDKPFFAEYSYKVDGYLDQWSPWQRQNLITLTNLPGGTHTLRVRTHTSNLMNEQPAETSLRFQVSIPFWRSPDFYKYAFLLGFLLIGATGYFYFRSRQNALRLQQQDQQLLFLQVQTLQAQLNPHFVFNVLGTMQRMIMTDDREQANRSLVGLARLIRSFLESSIQSEYPRKNRSASFEFSLAKEIELLTLYIEFEALQYRERFTYSIEVAPELEPSVWSIPPMLVQPFVENAIKHGLLYRDTPGHLWLRFRQRPDETLLVEIKDNGVGRAEARRRQAASIRPYVSRGSQLVERRIDTLNTLDYKIELIIHDLPEGGTLVQLLINTNIH